MRIVATIVGNEIVQVEKNPPNGELVSRNGMYMIPIAEGVKVAATPTSFVVPTAGSVVFQNFAGLLAQFPGYENVVFNPLIEATDVDDVDPTAFLNEGSPVTASYGPRFQAGRGTGGPLVAGNAPNSVALLPQNETAGPGLEKPGVLVSNTIDVGPFTGGMGATEFMVYWYVYQFSTTADVNSEFGFTAGTNSPSIRQAIEVDQENADLEVFLSVNDGANFFPVERLLPISFCSPATLIRIGFKNTNPTLKYYLAHYALIF